MAARSITAIPAIPILFMIRLLLFFSESIFTFGFVSLRTLIDAVSVADRL